jgi:hypothetical protein
MMTSLLLLFCPFIIPRSDGEFECFSTDIFHSESDQRKEQIDVGRVSMTIGNLLFVLLTLAKPDCILSVPTLRKATKILVGFCKDSPFFK